MGLNPAIYCARDMVEKGRIPVQLGESLSIYEGNSPLCRGLAQGLCTFYILLRSFLEGLVKLEWCIVFVQLLCIVVKFIPLCTSHVPECSVYDLEGLTSPQVI